MSKQYSEDFKQEVLVYARDHTIHAACVKFNVSKYAINEWKGNKRKNRKEANSKWYQKNGKQYYSQEKNKERHRNNARSFRKKNPDSSAKVSRKWRQKHKFKKLAQYANRRDTVDKISAFDIWKIAKKQKLKCAISGRKLTKENISLDHIVPLSRGGKNEPHNLRLVEHRINLALHVLTDQEFFDMCKSVVDYNGL